jgi:hypothetical protein
LFEKTYFIFDSNLKEVFRQDAKAEIFPTQRCSSKLSKVSNEAVQGMQQQLFEFYLKMPKSVLDRCIQFITPRNFPPRR